MIAYYLTRKSVYHKWIDIHPTLYFYKAEAKQACKKLNREDGGGHYEIHSVKLPLRKKE